MPSVQFSFIITHFAAVQPVGGWQTWLVLGFDGRAKLTSQDSYGAALECEWQRPSADVDAAVLLAAAKLRVCAWRLKQAGKYWEHFGLSAG